MLGVSSSPPGADRHKASFGSGSTTSTSMTVDSAEADSLVAEQIRRRIVDQISSGALAPGEKVGSERQLATDFGVSRATVRQVLRGLAKAGLVRRRAGRAGGTFVAQTKVERDLSRVDGLSECLSEQGVAASTRLLASGRRGARDTEASALGLDPADGVVEVVRLRYADGAPLQINRVVLPAARFPGLLDHDLDGSMTDLIAESYHVRVRRSQEALEVAVATPDEADLLQVPTGSALISRTRLLSDHRDVPFCFVRELVRADRTRMVVTATDPGAR